MTENQPISAVRAASLLGALVPGVARVELYPQWSDGSGEPVRRTRAVPYDAEGRIVDLPDAARRDVAGVLRRLGDVDLDRPQWLSVPDGTVKPVYPPVVPLWESPVSDTARDFAASVDWGDCAPSWPPRGGHDAGCAYVGGVGACSCAAGRPVVDVPVQGGVL